MVKKSGWGCLSALVWLASAGWAVTYEAVWPGPPQIPHSEALSVVADLPESWDVSNPVEIRWTVTASHSYLNTAALLEICDAAGQALHSQEIRGDLAAGQNVFSMQWDAAGVAPGTYSAVLTLDYAADAPVYRAVIPLERVSADVMRKTVQETADQADRLQRQLENNPRDNITAAAGIRLAVMKRARTQFEEAIAAAQWRRAYELTKYLTNTMRSISAQLSLCDGQLPVRPNSSEADVHGGWVGLALDTGSPEAALNTMDLARTLGIKYCLLAVDNFPEAGADPFAPDRISSWLSPILEQASALGMSLIIQFDQNRVAAWISRQVPDALTDGFANLAVDSLAEALKSHMRAVAQCVQPYRNCIAAVSVAVSPEMKFEGEAIRQAFIDDVKLRYGDRQSLNQAWRSHLASFDEIMLWGEYPEHDYHHKRAFQYDWQRFHQRLIAERLRDIVATARAAFPDIPITVTQNDEVLDSEPITRPCRPDLGNIIDWLAYQSTLNEVSPPYALDYPRCEAIPAAIRATAPGKTAVNLACEIHVCGIPVENRASFVHALMVDALLGDVEGVVIPVVSQTPEILEGVALAGMNLQNNPSVFEAFRNAPLEVAVLFSESAKIFDKGEPHLRSARYAFEGAVFMGARTGFINEHCIVASGLPAFSALIMPETPALQTAAFEALSTYLDAGGDRKSVV